MPNLFVLPATNKNNLYLEILYKPLQASFVIRPFSLPGIFASIVRGKKTIIHIHWEENVFGSRYALVSVLRMVYRFKLLFLVRLLGARVVWTMHNRLSHDTLHQRIDRLGRSLMWRLAQAVIIQNKAAAAQEAASHPQKKVVYIPHPNYSGAYGLAQPEARGVLRQKWGIAEGEVLLLALGAIRPYKRLEALTSAAVASYEANHTLRLLVAGKGDPAYIAELRGKIGVSKAVMLEPTFVPDADIPAYLAAADYAVFAHGESSLTSGAVVLALSYGLPVIAVGMQAGELIQDGVNGYAPQTDAALVELLKKLPGMDKLDPQKVLASVADASPELVAEKMVKLYTEAV